MGLFIPVLNVSDGLCKLADSEKSREPEQLTDRQKMGVYLYEDNKFKI